MPSISSDIAVIIPTTGRESLVIAVKSCLSQTISCREIIVVDDSAAQCVALPDLDKKNCPVLVRRTGGEKGANFARNLGLESVSSTYVTFLDDDDYFLPHRNTTIPRDNHSIIIHGSLVLNEVSGRIRTVRQPIGEHCWTRLLFGNIAGASPMLSLDLALNAGGFDEAIRRGQDWDFNLRTARMAGSFTILSLRSHVSCVSSVRPRISNQNDPWPEYEKVLAKHQQQFAGVAGAYWFARRIADAAKLKRLG